MPTVGYALTLIIAYLLGSIPTGFLVAKARGVDIRSVGSGNIGATNVFRILGKTAGAFVLLADAAKGWVAVFFVARLLAAWCYPVARPGAVEWFQLGAGVAAILGHNYTCWLHFRGGKGIATSAGVLLGLTPWALLIALGIWIVVFALSRYVSLASICAAFALPFTAWLLGASLTLIVVIAALAVLAIYKHKANIKRLLNGTENRIGAKKGDAGGATESNRMKITVLGAGAWGTSLARLLHGAGNKITLWGHKPEWLEEVRQTGRNDRFLPGISLPRELILQADLPRAIEAAECVVVAVPSQPFRAVTRQLGDYSGLVVSVTKGIEYDTGLTMCGVLASTAPRARGAALSGPTFAIEVARDIPTAIVAASRDAATAEQVQRVFSRPAFRVYTSTDLLGVELGGALKNVIAIAAGTSDGLGFGDNSKAALVTRAIVEIRRLGVACGAQPETFTGLSGLGDLMVTCFSKHSRNRGFGERVGRGEKPAEIAASTLAVAEGYPTARSAYQLARKHAVTTPVIDEVYAMLYEGKNVAQAVRDLMSRDLKPE